MKKVLVVDNDELILQFINDLLSKEGHQVVTAEDGLSALDILKINVPDVIFVDLVMPNIDGKKLCKIIRGMQKLRDVYIIILSATLAEQKINIAELGANACIAKGPLNDMAQHILSVIDQPDLASARCLAGQVIGIEGISPRTITAELLSVKRHFEVVLGRMSEEILEITSEGRIVYANPSALSLIGVPEKELLGSSFIELFAGDARQRVAELTKTIDDRPKIITEDSPVSLNGCQVTLNILPIDGEELTSIIINDVTERKRAEEALRQSEERYRSILDSVEEGYFEVDLTGKFTFFNDSLLKMSGVSRDELLGMDNRDYMTPDSAKKIYHIFREIYETGKPAQKVEHEIITKDGRHRVHESSASLMRDREGQPTGFRGIVRDVTERKQAEEALRESEEKYRTILESIEEAYFEVDIEGNFTSFNDSLSKILGYSKDELMGMNNRFYMTPESSEKIYELFNQIYRTGNPIKKVDYEIITKDGGHGFHELSASLMRNQADQPVGFRGIAREVTELKFAEEERKRLEARLQRAQKMEAIGTLAGGVAHDLNNILSGLVSYPELLLLEIPQDSPLRKPILTIQKSGEKAAAIVQDLLTLARRGVATTEVVNLNDIISDYLRSPAYEKLMSFHPDVQLEMNLETDVLHILGSPVHLSKTVMNLVSNAAEAMPGGGTIFISTENRYIDKPLRGYDNVREGDYVTLTVSDTGVGIASEDMERIFEPFYTKKVMGRSGTGLGMAVVWGTVKDHKGYIDVQSIEGKARPPRLRPRDGGQGTTFTLYFPVTRKEVATDQSLVSIEDYRGKGESIVVVDDVKEQREIASRILKKLGYSVTTVSSGEEAIDYLKENSADLLLLDMIMDPGIDGLETYKRALKLHLKQKAIIVSGFSETDRVKEAQRLGAGEYVRKPYLLEKIGLAVRDQLGK